MKFADIIIDISLDKLDKTFQYIIPDHLEDQVEVGMRVEVEFGKSKRTGYVIDITDKPSFDIAKQKNILSVSKGSVQIESRLIKLAYWLKQNYGGTVNQALKTVIPVKDTVKQNEHKTVRLLISEDEADKLLNEAVRKHYTAKARLLETLIETPVSDYSLLTGKLNISSTVIKNFQKTGIIDIESEQVFRNAVRNKEVMKKDIKLNDTQRFVSNSIIENMDKGIHRTYLIKGVTGSGKTEVYMELIDHVLKEGRSAIVLIPEIALTYQTVMRFYSRFGDVVSIINSRLSKGEKYDRFQMAKEGKIRIMIGPRSALFTPFEDIGLIVIDEEHEGAYKSETVPKYHARETAIEIARMHNADVVLGSATPSLDATYKAMSGEYKLFIMGQRANQHSLPVVEVVDLREELKNGNRSIFSDRLTELIEDRLSKKQQIMLFLNRRGYAGFINCRSCGYVVKCPHCDVSLTAHRNGQMVCHYCGYTEPVARVCPKCGSKFIGGFKVGTEKIEQETRLAFPDARVLRMDLDTTKGKEGHEKILEQFAANEADILIGTQMIVKGHDFPNVTLVGIILADLSLYSSDYTSAERTFQLLTQAAGRAGRGSEQGNVVIQTYNPEHYSVVTAAAQDYDAFYDQEILYRELSDYPPVGHMMTVRFASKIEQDMIECSDRIKQVISDPALALPEDLRIIGPSNASIYKINDIYYRVLYCKHKEHILLTHIKDIIDGKVEDEQIFFKNCSITYDFT